MIIWLTGLSGVGKTTIGRQVHDIWKKAAPNTVLMDGDAMRRLFAVGTHADAYSVDSRRALTARYCDLCAWLDGQDINVVCCTISYFEDLRQRNRRELSKYFEVFVTAPMEVLRRRDKNDLYERAIKGEIKNVVGVDLPLNSPSSPDMVIDNSADRQNFRNIAEDILRRAGVP